MNGTDDTNGRVEVAVDGVWGKVSSPDAPHWRASVLSTNPCMRCMLLPWPAGALWAGQAALPPLPLHKLHSMHLPSSLLQVLQGPGVDNEFATLACRNVGKPTPGRLLPGGSFGAGGGPVWICEPLWGGEGLWLGHSRVPPQCPLHTMHLRARMWSATVNASCEGPCREGSNARRAGKHSSLCPNLSWVGVLQPLPCAAHYNFPPCLASAARLGCWGGVSDLLQGCWDITWGIVWQEDRQLPSVAIQCDADNVKRASLQRC